MKRVRVTFVAIEKAVSITYSECAFAALVIRHAKRMSHATVSHVACRLCRIFSHYHTNGTIFREKKLLNIKCVLIFYTYLGRKISHYKNAAKYNHKCTKIFMYSASYSYQISIKPLFYGNTFEKYSHMKCHDSGGRFVPYEHKQDRHGAANSLFFFFAILQTCLERSCGHA
jgi:hypothetical protein